MRISLAKSPSRWTQCVFLIQYTMKQKRTRPYLSLPFEWGWVGVKSGPFLLFGIWGLLSGMVTCQCLNSITHCLNHTVSCPSCAYAMWFHIWWGGSHQNIPEILHIQTCQLKLILFYVWVSAENMQPGSIFSSHHPLKLILDFTLTLLKVGLYYLFIFSPPVVRWH